MHVNKKRWLIPNTFYKSGEINKYILKNRGFDDFIIEDFIDICKDKLISPYEMKGMRKAVGRIQSAIHNKEKILIYGDYDVDGVTGTSMLYNTLKKHFNAEVNYYVPSRFGEGYGLNIEAINSAHADGITLIITVDTGISAVSESIAASKLGIDIIITDHHEPQQTVPEVYAILNPKYKPCEYPEINLAGVGVVFKLVTALLDRFPEEYLDLAALGTVADLVPLIGENRIIVALGIEKINQNPSLGLDALLDVIGLKERTITAGHLGFQLGPRINASGRLETAMHAIELLICDNRELALSIANKLDEINRRRQEIAEQTFIEAKQKIEADTNYFNKNKVILLFDKDWNHGIIGIVASRLVEKYYRPVILIAGDGTIGKGSARSIEGLHLFNSLEECQHLLLNYGGHAMAAGFSINTDNIDELHSKFNQIALDNLTDEDYIHSLTIDAVLNIQEIHSNIEQIYSLEKLAPFGIANPQAKILVSGAVLKEFRLVGKDNSHIKFVFSTKEKLLDVMAFNQAEKVILPYNNLLNILRFELVGELTKNVWNQTEKPQLNLIDCAISPIQIVETNEQAKLLTAYLTKHLFCVEPIFFCQSRITELKEIFTKVYNEKLYTDPLKHKKVYIVVLDGIKQLTADFYRIPQRKDFKIVYQIIKDNSHITISKLIELCIEHGFNRYYCNLIINVFRELNFIQINSDIINIISKPNKSNLENSQLYMQLHRQAIITNKHILI